MYTDIKIYIQGYYWNQSLIGENFKDVSFMNYLNNVYSAWTPELEVTNLIIKDSLSPLSYDFEDVDGNSLTHYFTTSDFSFEVSDLPNLISSTVNGQPVTRMRQFLSLVPNPGGTGDTSYVKYIVRLKYQNNLIYQGIVNQDMIEEQISTSDDTNKIKVQCFGFEKEVKEYFSSKKLSDYAFTSNDLWWEKAHYGFRDNPQNNNSYYNPRWMTLETFLNYVFKIIPSTGYRQFIDITDIEPTGIKWVLFKNRHLTKQTTTRTVWFKLGLDQAIANNETVWGFFTKLCNAMGWVFYVRHENGGAYFTVKNRYSMNKTTYITVNSTNKLTPQKLAKTENREKVWAVYIPNGSFDCNNSLSEDLKYLRGYYVSNSDYYVQHTDPFKAVGIGTYSFNDNILVTSFEDENNLTIRYMYQNNILSEISYNKSNILILDAGGYEGYWRVDITNLVNYEDNGTNLNTYDIQFTGNYGSMLGYLYGTDPYMGNNLYTHDEYCSDQFALKVFRKNMRMLLQGRSNMMTELSINQIETNPLKGVYVDDEYYGQTWFVIREMKIDFINNITTMKLIKEL